MHVCKREKKRKYTDIYDPCYFMHISVRMYIHNFSFYFTNIFLFYYDVYLLPNRLGQNETITATFFYRVKRRNFAFANQKTINK